MKRKINIFAVTVMIISMLAGCAVSDGVVHEEIKKKPSTGESWTVMLYMCGSTLEEDYGKASEVLNSLMYDLPENINVLVETGGARSWSMGDIAPEYSQYFSVQKNGIRLVHQTAAINMGNGESLKNFYSWGMEEYPADNYMGIVWNHGGGPVGGVAYDSNAKFDRIELPELTESLSELPERLDIIGFDASLMSNIETAAAVSLYADYMIASEDIMPMCGWDYYGLMKYLSENPSAEPPAVGAEVCEGVKRCAGEQEYQLVSMAVTDLTKETMLSLAFEGMAGAMTDALDDGAAQRELMYAMNELEYLGGNSFWEGYSNIIDIGELTKVVSEKIGSPAANINNAINEVVVYKCMSDYHSLSSGLSVYYPRVKKANELAEYRKVYVSESYMEFIEKTCLDLDFEGREYSYTDNPCWKAYNDAAYENVLSTQCDKASKYILNAAHPEIITRAGVNYYMYSEKSSGYVYLYRDYNTVRDAQSGQYSYEATGRIPKLNSTPVSMYLVSQNTCFDIYSIPVVYEGRMTNLRVSRSKQAADAGEYRILGLWNGVDKQSSMADRCYTKLEAGDVIIPIYEVYGADGGSYVEGRKIRIGFGGAKITDKRIDDGDYIISFTVEDMFGVTKESNTNNLTASKGKLKIMDY